MRDSVRTAFPGAVVQHEGRCGYMYLDTRGLVTTGIGNLIDPVSLAFELPWLHPDDSPASHADIEREWKRVNAMRSGMVAGRYRGPGSLHLADDAVDALVASKRDQFWDTLTGYFPGAPDWPADAQMGLLLHAWAVGPHAYRRHWPKMSAALDACDWATVAEQCVMPKARASRNAAHQLCFNNAAAGGDPDTLYYPEAVV